MAFCKFSTEYRSKSELTLDSAFIVDYMPLAPEICTKVFLYGLFKCQNADESTNTLADFCTSLNITAEDVKSSFLFWQDQGLVTVLNLSPIEIRYLPIIPKKYSAKLFDKQKFAEFNNSIQEIIDGRMITPIEYKEYYILMDSMHLDQSALVMIAKYCTELKGNNVGYSYITTVAKNWAYEGIHTAKQVETKLLDMETLTSKVKDVMIALKSKKVPTFEDKTMFDRWTKQYGFDLDTIIHIAKSIKRGGMDKLSQVVDSYYSLKLFSISEIDNYEKQKNDLISSAKTVCRSLGLYYDNLDPVINTYILKWQQMGYSFEAINMVANICFKKYIRTFEAMDSIIAKYYAKGIVSIDSLNQYIDQTLSVDKKIKEILEKLQLSRQVTSWDRDFYHTWTYSWKFGDDIIDYALSLSQGKNQPMNYVNKILANWKDQGIDTTEKAKASGDNYVKAESIAQKKPEFATHSFSSEELNALFDNLDEVKLV